MDTIQDYRYIETREGLFDSKELPTYIPLMSHVQTLRKNDTEQVGFRSGKSCTSQLLNLTQHIEDGYEEGMITGTALVDLSAAYDTVNHRLLIQKLYNTMLDSQLCRAIQNLLSDRRFYVELNNERSRWRIQKNGLSQGSALSPTFGIIYCEWYGVRDFVVLSVVEVCTDYGGVKVFHVCLNFSVVYGVGVCVNVCGVVCCVVM